MEKESPKRTRRSKLRSSLYSVALVMSNSATLCTVAHQAPLSMGFFRQEYWTGLPCPPPGDLPDPGTEPGSPASPALHAYESFSTVLDGSVRKNIKKKKRRDGEIGKHKLNEMGALNMN